ncbi:MAG: hypothetical protein LBS45_00950, partial [Synergistaceae bacterium]|nr:hypothetical protein [Synergistaceae bacterium]
RWSGGAKFIEIEGAKAVAFTVSNQGGTTTLEGTLDILDRETFVKSAESLAGEGVTPAKGLGSIITLSKSGGGGGGGMLPAATLINYWLMK